MTRDTAPFAEQLQDPELLRMHFAAQQALESKRCGGRGGFRVDNVTPEMLEGLPGYLEQFIGGLFPVAYYDGNGNVQTSSGIVVHPEDTAFDIKKIWVDEESHEPKAWLRWRSLEEPQQETSPAVLVKPDRLSRFYRAVFGVLIAAEGVALGFMIHGSHRETQAMRDHAPQAEVADAQHEREIGRSALAVVPLVAGPFIMGVVVDGIIVGLKENKAELDSDDI